MTDTLIVVTADHDHTMTINGYSAKGNPVLDLVKNGDGSTQNDVDGKPFTTLVFGNGPNRADLRPTLTSNQVMGMTTCRRQGSSWAQRPTAAAM